MTDHSINFFSEEIEFELEEPDLTRSWIKEIVGKHQKISGEINYIFCSDEYLHQINLSYLSHDTYTDIITFDNSEEELLIEGDIYISIDRVKENAAKFQIDNETELKRVIIHGILHLIGFHDHSEEEKLIMREQEQLSLELFKKD